MSYKYYKISKKDLLALLEDSARFHALELGGVDNWEWEAEARHNYLKICTEECELPEDIDFEDVAEYDITRFEEIKE